jgi:hypothetical protein
MNLYKAYLQERTENFVYRARDIGLYAPARKDISFVSIGKSMCGKQSFILCNRNLLLRSCVLGRWQGILLLVRRNSLYV